jgi:hypothetical protein
MSDPLPQVLLIVGRRIAVAAPWPVEVASAGAMVAELDPGAVATIPIFPQYEFGVGCRCADSCCCRRAAGARAAIAAARGGIVAQVINSSTSWIG